MTAWVTTSFIALFLTSCSTQSSHLTSQSPHPSSLHDSRTDLIRDARQTYLRYLSDLQSVSEANNTGYKRFKSYLSDSAYSAEAKSFEALKSRGLHTSGATRLAKFVPQRVDTLTGRVTAYACLDYSRVKVLDAKDRDVTPNGRVDEQTFAPIFTSVKGKTRLEENATWSGESVC